MSALCIGLSGVALAETGKSPRSENEVRVNTQAKINIGAKIEDREEKHSADDDSVKRFDTRAQGVITNLTAIHTRISVLADRIDSRLKKLAAEKIDVSVSQKLLTGAREELRLAKISISDVETSFKAELEAATQARQDSTNSKSREFFTKTRASIKTAKDHLKAAHRNLVEAIANVKAGTSKRTIDTKGSVNAKIEVR